MDAKDSRDREFFRALQQIIDAVLTAPRQGDRADRRHRDNLAAHLHLPFPRSRTRRPDVAIAQRLAVFGLTNKARRAWLTDRLRHSARHLTRHGKAPVRGARALAWRAIIAAAAQLHESRVCRLRDRAFLDASRFEALANEGRRRQPHARAARTQYGSPGPLLRRLAVDRTLQRVTSQALGFRVVPAYTAVYMYDPPRSHMPPHLDSEDFEIIVHVVLEHICPRGSEGSALIVHGTRGDKRIPVAPGEAIVLAGRGAVHQWEPLGARESRMMIGIGFRRATRSTRRR